MLEATESNLFTPANTCLNCLKAFLCLSSPAQKKRALSGTDGGGDGHPASAIASKSNYLNSKWITAGTLSIY